MTGQEIVDCAIRECRHLPSWLAQVIDDAIAVGRGKEREALRTEIGAASATDMLRLQEIESLTAERDALQADYQRIIREVLACDPKPASARPQEDQLEPPWEVITRIRQERDALQAKLEAAERERDQLIPLVISGQSFAHDCHEAGKQIADLQATLEAAEQERDSFQRIGIHYQSVLTTAAELIAPGVCGRTAALVVTTDLPMLIAKLEAAEREMQALVLFTHNYRTNLAAAHADVRALAEDLQMAQGQWGDDYLWKKWELSESLSRPTVRKSVEGT